MKSSVLERYRDYYLVYTEAAEEDWQQIEKEYAQGGMLLQAEEQMRRVVALDEKIEHPNINDDRQTLAQIQARLGQAQ